MDIEEKYKFLTDDYFEQLAKDVREFYILPSNSHWKGEYLKKKEAIMREATGIDRTEE